MGKELRLAGICDIDAANAVLPDFTTRYNARLVKAPAEPDNLHRALNIEPDRLRDVFCFRDERLVGKQLDVSCQRQRIILAENDITRDLPGKYVDTFVFPDGRFEVCWKGISIPYPVFDKAQRAPMQQSPRTNGWELFWNTSSLSKTNPRQSLVVLASNARVINQPGGAMMDGTQSSPSEPRNGLRRRNSNNRCADKDDLGNFG